MAARMYLYGALLWLACQGLAAQPLVGASSEWAPFYFVDEQGQPQGIAVEIVQRALQRSGVATAPARIYPAKRLKLMLERGELDFSYAESAVWDSALQDQRFVYSKPYLVVHESLYFLSGHAALQAPLETLQGLRIGMIRGYSYPRLEPALGSGRLQRVETARDTSLLDLLLKGRVDAVAMVDEVFTRQVASRRLQAQRFERGAQLSAAPLSIKLQASQAAHLADIDRALTAMLDSGEVQRIRQAYLLP